MSQKVKLEGAKADKGLICSILHVNPEGMWSDHQAQRDDVMYFTVFIIGLRVLRINYFD